MAERLAVTSMHSAVTLGAWPSEKDVVPNWQLRGRHPLPPDAAWPDDAGEAVGRISSVRAHCKLGRCSLVLRIV